MCQRSTLYHAPQPSSGQPTTQSVNGDIWYTKDKFIITRFLTTDSEVYWCVKETPTKCVKAEIKAD